MKKVIIGILSLATIISCSQKDETTIKGKIIGYNGEYTTIFYFDEQAWLAKLEEDKPSWQQFLATEKGQHSISKAYGVNGIPRFMLFDSNGKIVTVDAPRPSEPDIRNVLLDMLK